MEKCQCKEKGPAYSIDGDNTGYNTEHAGLMYTVNNRHLTNVKFYLVTFKFN